MSNDEYIAIKRFNDDINYELSIVENWLFVMHLTFKDERLRNDASETFKRIKKVRSCISGVCKFYGVRFSDLNIFIKEEFKKDNYHIHALIGRPNALYGKVSTETFRISLLDSWSAFCKDGNRRIGEGSIRRFKNDKQDIEYVAKMIDHRINKRCFSMYWASKRLEKSVRINLKLFKKWCCQSSDVPVLKHTILS